MIGLVTAATTLIVLQPLPPLPTGAVVLDVQGVHVLVGQPEPAPKASDAPLRMRVTLFTAGKARASALDDQHVGYARFAGQRIVAVSPSGTLFETAMAPNAAAVTLHDHVSGAVGISRDGRTLVYARGDAPDLEVWRIDRGSAPQPVTRAMAPAWSPAVSANGQTVIFASARTGFPALWRVDGNGEPRQLTSLSARAEVDQAPQVDPFPAALTAPLVADGHVVFEGRNSVHVFTLEGAHRRSLPGAAAPHFRVGGVGAVTGGRIAPLSLKGGAR